MAWEHIGDSDRQRLANMSNDMLIPEAIRRGMNPQTLQRRIREWRQTHNINRSALRSPTPNYDGYLVAEVDDSIIISDLEVPDHHEEILEKAYEVGRRNGIRSLIFAGDKIASDQDSITTHDPIVEYEGPNYSNTTKIMRSIYEYYLTWYTDVWDIDGNHDRRVAKSTRGSAWYGMFFPDLPIHFSRYHYMYQYTSRGPVLISHPQNFSENAVGLGRALYDKESESVRRWNEKPHVVLAHTHQGQRGWTKDGQKEVIALGCCRDPLKTHYKRLSSNKFGEWVVGFCMIKNGYFYQYNLNGTKWDEVLI